MNNWPRRWFSLVLVCSLCSMAVLKYLVGLAMTGLRFSLFDLSVVNNLCPDHLYCCTHLLMTAWPQFCQQNLSRFWGSPGPEELRHLAHIPLLCKRAEGKTGNHLVGKKQTFLDFCFEGLPRTTCDKMNV